ncbi:4-phosphoerythronate dehydrogenase [Alteromonas sp. CYL-A6]|uniref:4-phosphoerythronate dehydrogenase n=1 Tax=Alteromonas nitratireducens TaxID=3390813 RepID=UPI0034AC83ED
MKIVVEDTIPFGREYFSSLGEVDTYSWQTITPQMLRDADYLVVRSTTKVDGALLSEATRLKLVTTATAGTNHLDTQWIDDAGISWNSAAGCNAVAVAEYVLSALLCAHNAGKLELNKATVGIVGAGHVGTNVVRLLDCLGMSYKLCDPPRERQGDPRAFVPLDEILNCDVITLHVPFTVSGPDSTASMIGEAALSTLKGYQLLINACRGEVIDEPALLTRMAQPDAPTVILDVFCNEPDIDTRMMEAAWMCTPHIAGHSVEGKVRGTQMVYEQVCQAMQVAPVISLNAMLDAVSPVTVSLDDPMADKLSARDLKRVVDIAYDIRFDDRHFRQAMAESNQFARLRKQYRVRRECSAYTLQVAHPVSEGIRTQLYGLGFTLAD